MDINDIKAVSLEVKSFILNVSDVKEESITDYLIWKWREIDKRFNYLSVTPFNRRQESTTTGADFDLELWLVGRRKHVSLAIQAKKFIKPYNSYVNKLNYPDGTKQQMNKLLKYSAAHNKLPFYFIYTVTDLSNTVDGAVFMADARVMEEFADGKKGKKISRDDIIRASNPFHCMFCCPHAKKGFYFPASNTDTSPENNNALPEYVRDLLEAPRDQPSSLLDRELSESIELPDERAFRAVGVYNMRDEDSFI